MYANADKEGGTFPRGVDDVREQAGHKLPRIFVTTPDGTRGIQGISFNALAGDMDGIVEQLAK